MKHHIYTLWASLSEEIAPWMIAAEDEFAWEGDPDRCEKVFQDARDLADQNDWVTREVTITIDIGAVYKVFEAGQVEGDVE